MKYALLIPAAGRGERLGDVTPKAFVVVNGRPLLWWSLSAFANDLRLAQVVIAVPAEIEREVASVLSGHTLEFKISVVRGGKSRQDSVGNALASVTEDVEYILVHDAARPLVSREVIENVLMGLEKCVAVVPGIEVIDTIKRVDSENTVIETLNRRELFAVQTPQGVQAKVFREAHRIARRDNVQCTDDVALIEHFGLGEVHLVRGDLNNLKLTHPHEIPRFEAQLRGNTTS